MEKLVFEAICASYLCMDSHNFIPFVCEFLCFGKYLLAVVSSIEPLNAFRISPTTTYSSVPNHVCILSALVTSGAGIL